MGIKTELANRLPITLAAVARMDSLARRVNHCRSCKLDLSPITA